MDNINFGEGGSASCVLAPPFNYNTNYDDNYISKISNISNDSILETIKRELIISKYLSNFPQYNKYFLLVDSYKILENDSEAINVLNYRNCNLNEENKYIITYSKNGSCKPLKKGDIVINKSSSTSSNDVTTNIYSFEGMIHNTYILRSLNNNLVIHSDKIKRFCGDMGNIYTILYCFGDKIKRRKNIKQLINSIKYLIKYNVIHCDIKLKNIVCTQDGIFKIIDFGGAFILDNNKYFEFDKLCNNLQSIDESTLNSEVLQHTDDFIHNLLLYISIHTEYYTPPEILILKLYLLGYNKKKIVKYIVKVYNIDDRTLKNKIEKLTQYILDNRKTLIDSVYCKTNKKKSFIYKFDVFSLGIVIREIIQILYQNFNINVEDDLINLSEQMTDLNYMERLNIDDVLKNEYFN